MSQAYKCYKCIGDNTFGGTNPDNTTIYLDRKIVQWRMYKVKYLDLYLIREAYFKIDLAKRKYYGSFNNIRFDVK